MRRRSGEGKDGVELVEISPEGEVKPLHSAIAPAAEETPVQVARLDAQLRPILDALPASAREPQE